MASTYSDLKIELIGTGDQTGTWGDTTNNNLSIALGEAITGSADVAFSSVDVTVTLTDTNGAQAARNLRLNLTGTSGGARQLILGSGCQIEKLYLINNGLADAVTVKNTSGTGIAVPAGKTMFVYNNATNVVDATTYLSSLTLGAALPVASGGTGATDAPNARTNLGATTLGGNVFTITNPSAITFPRFNADNTVSALDASSFRTAIGAGSGGGSVTSVDVSGGTTGLTTTGGPVTSSGTITFAGTLAASNGGTGATTLTANNVIIGNGTSAVNFVAPGTTGNVLTSNGSTWTSAAAGGGGGAAIGALQLFTGPTTTTYPGSDWLKCDGSIVTQATYTDLYSKIGLITDGLYSWTNTVPGSQPYFQLQYLNNQFSTRDTTAFLTSTDAITWSSTSIPSTSLNRIAPAGALAYGQSKYVSVFVRDFGGKTGQGYAPSTSTNLVTWSTTTNTFISNSQSNDDQQKVRFLNNNFVFTVGNRIGPERYSTNGTTWTTMSTRVGRSSPAAGIQDVTYGAGKYVAVSAFGDFFTASTSTDLVTWTGITTIPDSIFGFSSCIYANNIFVLAPSTSTGCVVTSTDAITWTTRSLTIGSATSQTLSLSAGAGQIFAAVSSFITSSKDGITWDVPKLTGAPNVGPLAFGGSRVAMANLNGGNRIAYANLYSYNSATSFALPKEVYVNSNAAAGNWITQEQIGAPQTLFIKAL
jgi:hypothetical protein